MRKIIKSFYHGGEPLDWINRVKKRNEEEGLSLRSKKTGKKCLFFILFQENSKVDYICPDCVQLLLMTSQEELQRAYDKAIWVGSSNQAWALESFIREKPNDTKRPEPKDVTRYSNRIRINRPVRHKAKSPRPVTI